MEPDALQRREPPPEATVVAEPRWVWALVWLGLPVLGSVVGLLVVPLARWVASLPWAPLQGPFELVERYGGVQLTIGLVVVGAAAGLLLAAMGAAERLTVTVSDAGVTLAREGKERYFDRSAVTAAFRDGKQLVLQGATTAELARDKTDLGTDELAAAFTRHGFRWHDTDPYAEQLRRWVPDSLGLPDGANAVLAARALAVEKARSDDADELRAELMKLGVVVRDENKRQYWRRLPS